MSDTDPRPFGPNGPVAADRVRRGVRDPEAEAARARVMTRLIGEDEGPVRIGRFTLLEKVAQGGMGVVFAAYDAELDRKIAVEADRWLAAHRR